MFFYLIFKAFGSNIDSVFFPDRMPCIGIEYRIDSRVDRIGKYRIRYCNLSDPTKNRKMPILNENSHISLFTML